MAAVLKNAGNHTSMEEASEELLIKLPDTIVNAGKNHETRGAPSQPRKLGQKTGEGLPNLLKMSKLSKAVMKLVAANEKGSREMPRYSNTGHQCWSSLRTREWQEFQRMLQEENNERDGNFVTPASFMYFNAPSRSLSTRGSRKPIRKQIASPDSDFYERARMEDFKRIETAYSSIKQSRSQRWRDILEGVPSQYDSKIKPIKVKFIFEDDNIIKKQRKARKLKVQEELNAEVDSCSVSPERSVSRRRISFPERGASESVNNERPNSQERAPSGQRGASRNLCRSAGANIPGPFVFPRPSDFVPDDGTKVDKMGVDWKFAKCRRENPSLVPVPPRAFSAPVAQPRLGTPAIPSPPKQHKASYNPVTEALRREGRCVAKLKGKVMAPEDLQVAKVWKRKLTNIIIPADMAKRDIPKNALIGMKSRGKTDGQCDRLDEEDEDFSEYRPSIARGESSDDAEGSMVTNS